MGDNWQPSRIDPLEYGREPLRYGSQPYRLSSSRGQRMMKSGKTVMATVRIGEYVQIDHVQRGRGCWIDCEASPLARGGLNRKENAMPLDQVMVDL